ncbi:unnamed protein product, partial [Strongylus vulgaris]
MVFITNLAYEVRWAELKDVLREHGGEVVFVELLEDRNGQPKGNAIAEFKTREGAANCLKNLDGFEIRKRKMITKAIRSVSAKYDLHDVRKEASFGCLAVKTKKEAVELIGCQQLFTSRLVKLYS